MVGIFDVIFEFIVSRKGDNRTQNKTQSNQTAGFHYQVSEAQTLWHWCPTPTPTHQSQNSHTHCQRVWDDPGIFLFVWFHRTRRTTTLDLPSYLNSPSFKIHIPKILFSRRNSSSHQIPLSPTHKGRKRKKGVLAVFRWVTVVICTVVALLTVERVVNN